MKLNSQLLLRFLSEQKTFKSILIKINHNQLHELHKTSNIYSLLVCCKE